MKNKTKFNNLRKLLEESGATGAIGRAFDHMDIAEEVLKKVFLHKSNEPRLAFRLCQTPDWVETNLDSLYRVHITEQMKRLKSGKSLSEPTTAEALYVAYRMSLDAPKSRAFLAAYHALFKQAGIKIPDGFDAGPMKEAYPGETKEAISELLNAAKKLNRGAVSEIEEEQARESRKERRSRKKR